MSNNRKDGKDQEQVNCETGNMQDREAANPQQNQNDSQDEEHFAFFLCGDLAALSAHGRNI